ncbi:MAG: glycosyltransferase family 2 protein [Sphaerochaeta sp.]
MQSKKDDRPLVSVVIISYNQEDYILECLESIRLQTYDRIELIVSDDCSSDGTWRHIEQWESNHGPRFEKIHIHRNEVNLGITGNLSGALNMVTGEYVKMLGADDLLFPNAIARFVEVSTHDGYDWVMSNYVIIDESGTKLRKNNFTTYIEWVLSQSSNIQLMQLLIDNYIAAPSVFLSHSIICRYGNFENGPRNLEDAPMWISMLKEGNRVHYIPEELVYYRIHGNSFSNSENMLVQRKYLQTSIELLGTYVYPAIPKWACFLRWHVALKRYQLKLRINNSKITPSIKIINRLNPIYMLRRIDPDRQRFNRYLVSKYARRLELEERKK